MSAEPRPTLRFRARRKARSVDRRLYLETNHRPERAALVLGSGRGGTTWIAEQLASQTGSRLIFEPFHPSWTRLRPPVPLFADPASADAGVGESVRRTLGGAVRSRQTDRVRIARVAASRVVKDIHTANLLPWYRAAFPRTPVVFVVRHPIAVSLSRRRWTGEFYGIERYLQTEEGRRRAEDSPAAAWLDAYDEHRRDPEPLVRLVAEWCLENAYPLSLVGADPGTRLVYYEQAVLDPVAAIGEIVEFCGAALSRRRPTGASADDFLRPSAMDWFGTARAASLNGDWEERLGSWRQDAAPELVARCLAVVDEFGIELPYDDGALPRVEGVSG